MIKFRYEPDKALEVLLYIVENTPIKDRLHVLKVLYFADREHLCKYGRFINGDTYYALEYGPVPDETYNLIKEIDPGKTSWPCYCFDTLKAELLKAMECEGDQLVALRSANNDFLSESDIECLNSAIAEYGNLPINELEERSHDEAYSSVCPMSPIPVENIINTLPNGDMLREYIIQDY